jgi:hypothetical protein
MSEENVEKIVVGSTHHTWQFGKEVESKLRFMAEHPEQIEPLKGSIVFGNLTHIIRESKASPHNFELVMLKTRKKASKNNHCWIVVSDFWAEVMKRLKIEFGYRSASDYFLKQFCKFTEKEMAYYAENFHLHFVSKSEVSNTMTFWKNTMIAEHKNSIEFIKRSNCYLQVIDTREYPKIGWIDILPADVYRSSKFVFKSPIPSAK